MLRLLRSGLVGSALASSSFSLAAAKRRADKRPVALLVPLTGAQAALGVSMRNAASLVQTSGELLQTFDTGGTPEGAIAAARAAMKARVGMILGPLNAAEVAGVTATVAGKLPVIAFTNDSAQAATGAFVFGITPAQATGAILRYARSRGVRSLVAISDGTPWTDAAAAAAKGLEGELGLTVRRIEVRPGEAPGPAGDAPDAVLLPGAGDSLLAAARNVRDTGIQLLGTLQALDNRPVSLEALDGAWLASPDPTRFGDFAATFVSRHGGSPGAIAALARDAAAIADQLRTNATLDRESLLAADPFPGVAGTVRFRSDGSVARELAIVVARPAGYEVVASAAGA